MRGNSYKENCMSDQASVSRLVETRSRRRLQTCQGNPLNNIPATETQDEAGVSAAGSHALSGNTSDASDIVCAWLSSRESKQARTECRTTTTRVRPIVVSCCAGFSLPLLRDDACGMAMEKGVRAR